MFLILSILLSLTSHAACQSDPIELSDAVSMCNGINPMKPFYKCASKDCFCADKFIFETCKVVNGIPTQDSEKKKSIDDAVTAKQRRIEELNAKKIDGSISTPEIAEYLRMKGI